MPDDALPINADAALDTDLTTILNAAYIAGQHAAGRDPASGASLMPPDLTRSAIGDLRRAFAGYQVARTMEDMTSGRVRR